MNPFLNIRFHFGDGFLAAPNFPSFVPRSGLDTMIQKLAIPHLDSEFMPTFASNGELMYRMVAGGKNFTDGFRPADSQVRPEQYKNGGNRAHDEAGSKLKGREGELEQLREMRVFKNQQSEKKDSQGALAGKEISKEGKDAQEASKSSSLIKSLPTPLKPSSDSKPPAPFGDASMIREKGGKEPPVALNKQPKGEQPTPQEGGTKKTSPSNADPKTTPSKEQFPQSTQSPKIPKAEASKRSEETPSGQPKAANQPKNLAVSPQKSSEGQQKGESQAPKSEPVPLQKPQSTQGQKPAGREARLQPDAKQPQAAVKLGQEGAAKESQSQSTTGRQLLNRGVENRNPPTPEARKLGGESVNRAPEAQKGAQEKFSGQQKPGAAQNARPSNASEQNVGRGESKKIALPEKDREQPQLRPDKEQPESTQQSQTSSEKKSSSKKSQTSDSQQNSANTSRPAEKVKVKENPFVAATGGTKAKGGELKPQSNVSAAKQADNVHATQGWLAMTFTGTIQREKGSSKQAYLQNQNSQFKCAKVSSVLFVILSAMAAGAKNIEEIIHFMEKKQKWFKVLLGVDGKSSEGLPSRQMIWWMLLALDGDAFDEFLFPWLDELRGKKSQWVLSNTEKPILPHLSLWETPLGLIIGQSNEGEESVADDAIPAILKALNLSSMVIMAAGLPVKNDVEELIRRLGGKSIVKLDDQEGAFEESQMKEEVSFESYREGEERIVMNQVLQSDDRAGSLLKVEYELQGKEVEHCLYSSRGLKNPADYFFDLFRLSRKVEKKSQWQLNLAFHSLDSMEGAMKHCKRNLLLIEQYAHNFVSHSHSEGLSVAQKMKKAYYSSDYLLHLLHG